MVFPTVAIVFSLWALDAPAQTPRWETYGPEYPFVDFVASGRDGRTVFAAARQTESGPSALFRSSDGGREWSMLAQALPGETIRQIEVDPTGPDRMLAWTTIVPGGVNVYRSEDAGASWRLTRTQPFPTGSERVFFDPGRPDTAFFVTRDLERSTHGDPWRTTEGSPTLTASTAWITPDGALLWTTDFCSRIPCYSGPGPKRIELSEDAGDSISAVFPAPCLRLQTVAYADSLTAYAAGPDCPDLLRSQDGGRTWEPWDPSGYLGDLHQDRLRRRLTQISVDPGDPSTLYGLAESSLASGTGEILRSTDAGETWEVLARPGGVTTMTLSPSGRLLYLYAGTRQGVFRTAVVRTRTIPPRSP